MRTCTQCGHEGTDVRARLWFMPNEWDDGIADVCQQCSDDNDSGE